MEVEYITTQGDRWDLIAYKHYGDPFRVPEIAAANINVPLHTTLPAGLILRIPVLSEAVVSANLLPPWKQS